MDYGGLIWILDYRALSWINGLMMDYALSWSIVDYCGTLWMIVDYHWFFDMHRHGIAWIARYAPLCTPRL